MYGIYAIKHMRGGGNLWETLPWEGPILVRRKRDAYLKIKGYTREPQSSMVTITLMVNKKPVVVLCQNRYNLVGRPFFELKRMPPDQL